MDVCKSDFFFKTVGFWSGWRFLAAGQFGPPILANFWAKRAIFEVWAGSGHPKSSPARQAPSKSTYIHTRCNTTLEPLIGASIGGEVKLMDQNGIKRRANGCLLS